MIRLLRQANLVLFHASLLLCLPPAQATPPAYSVLDLGPARISASDPWLGTNLTWSAREHSAYINDLGNVIFPNADGALTVYHAALGLVKNLTPGGSGQPEWYNNLGQSGGPGMAKNSNEPGYPTYWRVDGADNLSWSSSPCGPENSNGVRVESGPNGYALFDRTTGTYENLQIDRTQMIAQFVCINDAGDVAGNVRTLTSSHAGVCRRHGNLEDLGTLGTVSAAEAIKTIADKRQDGLSERTVRYILSWPHRASRCKTSVPWAWKVH